MGLLSNIKAALPTSRDRYLPDPALIARQTGINRFGLTGWASLELFPAENPVLLQQGYMENHYVFTIADWKAQRLAMAPPIQYEVKDQKSYRKFKAYTPYQKANEYVLRSKALAEVEDERDVVNQSLAQPNPLQTWGELMYALSVYWDFGNALLYGPQVQGGPNDGFARQLFLLPTGQYSGKNASISGFEYFVDVLSSTPHPLSQIEGRSVLHLRRFNPDPTLQGGQLWGMSKLAPARRLLTKSINALDAEAEAMQNRGSRSIIFPKYYEGFEPPAGSEAEKAGEDMRRKLKQAGSGGIATNSIELGSINIGASPVDLNILQSNIGTKEEFCALWHLDANSVFSSTTEGSLGGNKQEEANKASLRGGVLPDQALIYQKLSEWWLGPYNARNKYERHIEANTDVYPELQQDKKELFSWLSMVPLTGDEMREAAGYEAIGTPEMQVPLLATGRQPITDFAQPDPAADPASDPANDGTY
ncbi:phage portal protein [Spirosoma sp. 209]|uniref:phage portal protein n=1 Tax=Spirosoma sp. 209 TaxID=1955701 RepID=UPI00098D4CAD|nr:phage portal protein [Spirosoma sp. 209]